MAASKATRCCRHRDLRPEIMSVGAAGQTWRGPVSLLSQQQASRARGGSPVPLTLGPRGRARVRELGARRVSGYGCHEHEGPGPTDSPHAPPPRGRTWARSSGVGKAGQVQAPRTDGRRDRRRVAAVPSPHLPGRSHRHGVHAASEAKTHTRQAHRSSAGSRTRRRRVKNAMLILMCTTKTDNEPATQKCVS